MNFDARRLSRSLDICELIGKRWKFGIEQRAKCLRLRHQVVQQAEPLGFHSSGVKLLMPVDIAAGAAEARDEATLDRIGAKDSDDGN